jgi:hypothetical protein
MKALFTLTIGLLYCNTICATGELMFRTKVYFTAPDSNATPGTVLSSSGATLQGFNFSGASASHPIFTSGLYFPVTDCRQNNLWVRVRHISADPNGINNGQAVNSTSGDPCFAGNNTIGGFTGFLYQVEIYRDVNLTGARANILGTPYPTGITVASLETLCCPGGPYEWLAFEILNPESSGWNLNSINFTGTNTGSNPGFTNYPVYVDKNNNSYRPPEFVPQFPTGSKNIYAITLTNSGYSEFKMTASQVSKFRYGYEFFNWGYQGMSMSFGDPPLVQDSIVNEYCHGAGGSIFLKPAGLGPYKYTWSNGDTTAQLLNVSPGTYTVTVTDANGCQAIKTSEIIAAPLFNTTIQQSTADSGILLKAGVIGGEPPFSYLWTGGSTADSLLVYQNGWYSVAVTDERNCVAKDSVEILSFVQIPPKHASKSLWLWPNPTRDVLKVQLPSTITHSLSVKLYSHQGREYHCTYSQTDTFSIIAHLNHLPAGLYQLIVSDDVSNYTGRLIVK